MASPLDTCETISGALECGLLIDVSKVAREAGIRLPVLVSGVVLNLYLRPGEQETTEVQEQRLRMIINRIPNRVIDGEPEEFFEVSLLIDNQPQVVRLEAWRGKNDDGTPIVMVVDRRSESWETD